MRLHSDVITEENIRAAAKSAGVTIATLNPKNSRSRKYAYDVALAGSGAHGGAYGSLPYKVATWDEWGMVLGTLYELDAELHTGKNGYQDAEHFHWVTVDRYRHLTPPYAHHRHRWERHGYVGSGTYLVIECNCGATLRRMAYGHDYSELTLR